MEVAIEVWLIEVAAGGGDLGEADRLIALEQGNCLMEAQDARQRLGREPDFVTEARGQMPASAAKLTG